MKHVDPDMLLSAVPLIKPPTTRQVRLGHFLEQLKTLPAGRDLYLLTNDGLVYPTALEMVFGPAFQNKNLIAAGIHDDVVSMPNMGCGGGSIEAMSSESLRIFFNLTNAEIDQFVHSRHQGFMTVSNVIRRVELLAA